jgi:hypothetical protein
MTRFAVLVFASPLSAIVGCATTARSRTEQAHDYPGDIPEGR